MLGATGRLQLAFGALATVGLVAQRVTPSQSSSRSATKASGRSRWAVWPAPSMTASVASGMSVRHPLGEGDELGVERAGHDEHRHRQRRQPVPQRLLRAGAGEAQARRQPGGGVAAAVVEAGVGERGEQRLGEPAVEERVDAVALDATLQVHRPRRGGPPARRRPRCPAVALTSTSRSTSSGRASGEVEAQPAAHRVADVRGRTAGGAEQVGAGDEVGRDRRRAAVARRVDGDDLEAVGQAVGDRCPRPSGLGEPVDERRARWSAAR